MSNMDKQTTDPLAFAQDLLDSISPDTPTERMLLAVGLALVDIAQTLRVIDDRGQQR